MCTRRLIPSRLPIAAIALLIAGLSLPVLAQNNPGGGPPDGDPPHGNGPPERGGPPPGRGNAPDWAGPREGGGPPSERGPRFGAPPAAGDIPGFCTPGGRTGGPDGQAGLSSIAMLDFESEDDENNARGKLMYRWIAPLFDFVFNANGLEPEERAYTLVAYPEGQDFSDADLICLGSGVSTVDGTFHLQDAWDIGSDLPPVEPENGDGDEQPLATIALIDHGSEIDVTAEGFNCAAGDPVLQSVEGMFYVRHVDEDEENGNNGE